MSNNNTDWDLILDFLSGDWDGEEKFLNKYGGLIKHAVYKGVRKAEIKCFGYEKKVIDREDFFHDTIAYIWDKDKKVIRVCRRECPFHIYLYIICERYAENKAKKEIKKTILGIDPLPNNLPAALADDMGLQKEEEKRAFREAMFWLPLNDQIFIFLMYYQNKSVKEISDVFGWDNQNSAHVRKKRIIEKLRDMKTEIV